MTKGVGSNIKAEHGRTGGVNSQFVGDVAPPRHRDIARERITQLGTRGSATEGPEIVGPDDQVGGPIQEVQINGSVRHPGQMGREVERWALTLHHEVPVGPPLGRVPGVELLRHGLDLEDAHPAGELHIETANQPLRRLSAVVGKEPRGQIDVNHLGEGVDPGIGPAGPNDLRWGEQPKGASERFTKQPDHRLVTGLFSKSMETSAVIGEVDTPPLGGVGYIKRTQCAPSERCRPDAAQASRYGCSRRDAWRTEEQSP